MKALSLRRALAKAGVAVKLAENHTHKWSAVHGDRTLEWWESHSGNVECLRCRWVDDKDDLQSDYHAGHFARTLKGAIDYLTESGAWSRQEAQA